MFSEQQQNKFGIMRAEVIDLNILAYCYIKKINRFGYLVRKSTRYHVFEEFIACRYMENGLILHLTKLDDDPSSSDYSFRNALKELNKSKIDIKERDKLNGLLTKYRKDLNELKNNQRNTRLAHLRNHDEINLDQFLDFDTKLYPLIKQANAIGDMIWGKKIVYGYRLGQYEGILDFRKLTEDLKVDLFAEKDYRNPG